MSNTWVNPSLIAREALMQLKNNCVLANLVYRDISSQYGNSGDTINVIKPPTYTANVWNGSTVTVQGVSETSVPVKLDKTLDVSVNVTSSEYMLNLRSASEQIVKPAMIALAQKVDEYLALCYKGTPYYVSQSSTKSISDFANVAKSLNITKVPMTGRNMVVSPTVQAGYGVLDAILHADKSGSTEALRENSMGRIMGIDTYMDQNVATHAKGTVSSANASGTAGAYTVALASLSAATATLKEGDLFTIAGDTTVYTVTEDAAGVSSAIAALKIWPALQTSPSTAAITIIDSAKESSFAFHKNAIALVMRTAPVPDSAGWGAAMSDEGISVRCIKGYNMDTKSETISFDLMMGYKVIDPRLMCRFIAA